MTTFCKTLSQTPDDWGETAYIESDRAESFVRKLNRDLDWNVSADQMREWDLVEKLDGHNALYRASRQRWDEYAIFTKQNGQYDMAHRGSHWANFYNPPQGNESRRAPMSIETALTLGREWLAMMIA